MALDLSYDPDWKPSGGPDLSYDPNWEPKVEGFADRAKRGLGDIGLKLNAGATVDLPQQVIGINDLLTKSSPLSRAAEVIIPDAVKNWRNSATDAARASLEERGQRLQSETSPEQQAADQKKYLSDQMSWENLSKDGLTSVPGKVADLVSRGEAFGEGFSDWRKVTGSAAQSLPSTIVAMGPVAKTAGAAGEAAYAASLAKSGLTAAATSAEKEAAMAVAQKAALHASERTAMLTGGLSEGAQGAGAANEQTRQAVMQLPIETLRKSPYFQEAVKTAGGDEVLARRNAADAAASSSAAGAFVVDALFGALGDKYIGTAAAGRGSRVGAVARGVAQETPTETIQSGGEKFSENRAIQQFADPSQKLMQNVGEEAIGGGLSGGLMGGVMGGAMHRNTGPSAPPQLADTGPLSRSANIALATNAGDVLGAVADESRTEAAPVSAAEKALYTPKDMTALDRVSAIDRQLGELQRSAVAVGEDGQAPVLAPEQQIEWSALQAERDAITQDWPAAVLGTTTSFSTESGARLDANYALMDVGDLITSHDEQLKPSANYPAEMQPRDRGRSASEVQVSGIAQKLDPARLGASADAATGAPIVGADGLVESGNARTIALKRVYQGNSAKADEYRQFLEQHAADFGLSAEAVASMPQPVLVRVRNTPVNRTEFARQANASSVAQMSPSETAQSDAARMDVLDDLRPDEQGDFTTSRDFIRRFMATLPVTEQGAMIDAGGQLSPAGYNRIRNAVLAKAYGDSPVLVRMVESLDDNLRNVGKALMTAAPTVAKTRQSIAEGVLFDADITPDLLAAVEELSRIKDSGQSLSEALAQAGMFGERFSPETRQLIQFLADNLRRPRVMAEFIQDYMAALVAAGNPKQGSVFGDIVAPKKEQLLSLVKGGANGAVETSNGAQEAPGHPGVGQEGGSRPAHPAGRTGGAQETVASSDEVDQQWRMFPPESGTMGITRSSMPQVKISLRPAMLDFMQAQGIHYERMDLPADELKPTQAEYSVVKAERARSIADDRSDKSAVLVSSDGYVLDGHHRWIAKAQEHQPVNVIRFDAPIYKLLDTVREFSGVTVSNASDALAARRTQAVEQFYDAAGDLAQILTKHTRAAMVPENTPDLMPTLVKLFDAAFAVVGTDIKRATAWVKGRLKVMPEFKTVWNKILPETYLKAAREAVDHPERTFSDVFDAPASADPYPADFTATEKSAMRSAKPDSLVRVRSMEDLPSPDSFISSQVLAANKEFLKGYKKQEVKLSEVDRSRAEALLTPALEQAAKNKESFDAAVKEIAHAAGIGYLIPPLKAIGRASEKLVVEYSFDVSKMQDLLRATVVVDSYQDVQAVFDEIAKRFTVARTKNRTTIHMTGQNLENKGKLESNYQDVLCNVILPDGQVAEIQINAPEMIAAKEADGHKLYELQRPILDMFGTADVNDPLYRALDKVQKAYYAAAEAAIRSRAAATLPKKKASEVADPLETGAEPSLRSSTVDSSRINQPSPGMKTYSSPPNDVEKAQPAGNLSGTFITPASDSSIAKIKDNDYTQSSEKSTRENDENGSDRSGRAQGKEPGAVRPTVGGGNAGGVRARPSGGNQRSDRNADSGIGQQAGNEQGEEPAGSSGDTQHGGQDGNGNRPKRNAGLPAGRDIPSKSGRNYVFGDNDLTYSGSWQAKARQNVEAVELLKKLETDGRQATRTEQAVLAKFIGWGSSEIANSIFGTKLDGQLDALRNYDEAVANLAGRPFLTNANYREYAPAFNVLKAKNPALNWYTAGNITKAMLDSAKPDPSVRKWGELRDRLKVLLTEKEWAEASRSTQYAHYTSKPVVKALLGAVTKMGFKGGTILEPGAGIGVFPGLMSSDMANNSIYTGIEFDPITGGILKQLMPDERILVESFIDSKLPENFYDVAFGNPPFGAFKVLADTKYVKHAFALHDYFFAKTIDSVKPGGLVVFVTSRYTMDKKGDKARSYMAERADLVGAIRLPQTAFQKNAGTEVVTDVLFLRKKVPGQTFENGQSWAGLGEVKTEKGTALVNEYFAAHPEMVLGTHSQKGSMYGKDEYTVLPNGDDIEAQFVKVAESLPADVFVAGRGSAAEAAKVRDMDFNPKAKKEGSFYVSDAGVLMQREGGVGARAEEKHQKNAEVIKDYVSLRDAVKQTQFDQLNDGDWEVSLKALQKAYARFTKKHGRLFQHTTYMQAVKVDELDEDGTPTGNKVADEEQRRRYPMISKLRADPEYTLALALEDFNEDTGEIKDGKWLTERTLGRPVEAEVKTPSDALLATLNDLGHVDIAAVAERIGLNEQETIDSLGTLIYDDPASGWIMADEYLSGNVKKKLAQAEEAAKSDKAYARNVEALKEVQPEPRSPEQITPQIGMNWIPGEVYQQFLEDVTGVKAKIEYVKRTREWVLTTISGEFTPQATSDWGVGDKAHAGWLMDKALSGAAINLNKSVSDGKGGLKQVFDPDRTEAANQKRAELREKFREWLFQDGKRTTELVQLYNDKFNTNVQRKFDGQHLTLPGTSKLFNIFAHVKRGAWRVIQTGNTYLAHAVGSGKTFEMVISAMEQKRLGLVKKPMVIVPGHMLQQFASEWQQLYPTARLMVADETDFHTDNRRRFVSRVAMSDLDGVIMTHSSFGLLDLDPVFKQKMIEQELDVLRASYEEAGGDLDDVGNKKVRKDPKIKRIESQIEKLEQQLSKAMSSDGKDKNVRFDEMGVDMLYVDEAHLFRKLSFATARQVKGIDPNGSQMAWDLYMKTRWLAEKNPGRYLVMASGTAITNTTAELYTVQRFMAPQALEENGLAGFDDWAAQFGEESTTIESTASGKYEPVTRFQNFVNVGEMTQMFRDFADVLNEDHLAALLGDERPKVKGGGRKSVITPKTTAYAEFLKETLGPRIVASRAWKPTRDEKYNPDPIIAINIDARLAAIDMRFMDPTLPNDPDSKLNKMIDGVIRVYKETEANEYREKSKEKDKEGNKIPGPIESIKGATQMVFFESGFGKMVAQRRGFNARAWMEKRLRDSGIPSDQLAFMEDYKKSSAKLKLFADVNKGKVRVLVGSSAAMGTGVNAQQRLIALHHLDAPYVPATLEQREGRIVRQGNKNSEVQIYAYSMFGSFDENMWSMLARKKFFIEQALSGDPNIRSIEDVGEVNQLQMAAGLVAENPFVMQHAGAKAEVEKLTRLYRSHEAQRAKMRDEYDAAGRSIERNTELLPNVENVAAKVGDLSGDQFTATADGAVFAKRKEWGEALMSQFKALSDKLTDKRMKIGEISGFNVVFHGRMALGKYQAEIELQTPEPTSLAHDALTDPVGVALRATNALVALTRKPAQLRAAISEAKSKRAAIEPRLDAPFPLAEQLANKHREADEFEQQMLSYSEKKTGMAREQELENAWAERTGAITPLFSRGNAGSQAAVRELQSNDDLSKERPIHRSLDGAELQALRRAAAGIKRPEKGIFLRIEPDGRAIATGPKGARIPETFRRFAHENGLAFFAERRVPKAPAAGESTAAANTPGGITDKSSPMPIAYRESGAIYFGEGKGAAIDRTDKTRFSQSVDSSENIITPSGGIALRDLKAVRDRVAKELTNLPPVHVLDNPSQAPESLREHINKAGAWADVEGALHEGEIYLFASGLSNEERAEFVLATHEITHYGLRGKYGMGLDAVLQNIWLRNGRVRKAAAAAREKHGLSSNLAAVEEVLADMPSADLVRLQGWRKMVGAVRDWFAGHGFERLADKLNRLMSAGMSDQQKADFYVADVLRQARGWVKHGKGSAARQANASVLSRAEPQKTADQRADDILAKRSRTARPVDAVFKAVTQAARIDRVTTALYNKAGALLDRYTPEQIKAGFIADYGIPEAVTDRRVMMQSRMKQQVRSAGALIDKLGTLTRAESRVAYEWMNNADPQASAHFEAQLPPESVKIMEEVKAMVDALSQEAVKLGQLDPEVFKRNRFEYLRRSYVKHTAELTGGEAKARGRAIAILGDQYKGRGLVDAVSMAKIKNVAPEWWGRKLQNGKADTHLKGERFIRLERRAPNGEGNLELENKHGPGELNPLKKGKLRELAYWPAGEPVPPKFSAWEQAGTWEVRDTKGNDLVLWRDFSKQERQAMGEIDEARYAIAKTLHGMIHDVETGRYLEWLAQRYAAKDASQVTGKLADASDRMRDVFTPDEWVQVPETKISGTSVHKYGLLAGRYLPGPIWNDVRQTVGGSFKPFGETYAEILKAWKISKTALSPAVHTNNVMANFVMADWHDVTAGHVHKALKLLLAANDRDGKGILGRTGNLAARAGIADREAAKVILNRFEDSGGNIGTWATAELQKEQIAPLLEALEKELGTLGQTQPAQVGVMVALQHLLHARFPSAWAAFKPTRTGKALVTEAKNMLELYEAEDQVFRVAAWLRAKEDGASDIEAGKLARKSFLDYNINAPWVQAMRKSIFPFISFTYRAVPMLAETMAKKPWKLMKLAALAGGLNMLGYLLSGGDEDKERKLLPEEKAGRVFGLVPKLLRMPWNDANNDPVFMDVRRFVPVGDIFDTGAGHSAVPMLPAMVPGGPAAVIAEILLNRAQFTGREIVMETDTPAEQAGKVMDHLYKAFAPNIPVLPGTYSWTNIVNAGKGRTDAFGREQSVAQAAASSVGVKLGSYPADVMRLNAQRELQYRTMEIDRNISRLKREMQKHGIDRDEYASKVRDQVGKKQKLFEEFRQRTSD